jgi:NAD+ diphosphatase
LPRFNYCPQCRTPLIETERGGQLRQVCPADGCGFVNWNNPTPVVAAIVEHADQVVLVRSIGRPPTWFGLVAGFVERGEHPDNAIVREIEEEIGIFIDAPAFLGTYAFQELNQIIFVYHAAAPHLEIRLCTEELADYRIVPVAELRPWSRGTGPALRDWLVSRGYDPVPVDFGRHIDG